MDEPQAPLTEREQFEFEVKRRMRTTTRWGATAPGCGAVPEHLVGTYIIEATEFAWRMWQARAALSTAPVQGVLTAEDRIGTRPFKGEPQVGEAGACFCAQVFGPDGESVAIFDATDDPSVASARSRLLAAALNAALASAPHPPSNTLGDAASGPGDPVASLPTPPIAVGDVRSVE